MASAQDEHRASIEVRLQESWPTTDIVWPGVEHKPGDDPYIEAAILWGDGTEYDRGSIRRNQLVGVLNINLYAKPGTGMGVLYGYADTLRDLFNHDTVDAVRFGIPTGPNRVDADGTWLQLNLSCPFRVEETT